MIQLHHILEEKGSKYSATFFPVHSEQDIKDALKQLKKDKKYAKATHNTYALRYENDKQTLEKKSDDGETGAGIIILQLMQQANINNAIIIITRWYGGVHLGPGRFTCVSSATKKLLEHLKKSVSL